MIRKDLKIGLYIGSTMVFVGWAIYALFSDTPQQRRQNQLANEPLQIVEKTSLQTVEPPQADNPQSKAAAEIIHTVNPGETLSSIAVQYYGNSAAWQTILDTNKGTLQSPSQLRPGMRLKIPIEK